MAVLVDRPVALPEHAAPLRDRVHGRAAQRIAAERQADRVGAITVREARRVPVDHTTGARLAAHVRQEALTGDQLVEAHHTLITAMQVLHAEAAVAVPAAVADMLPVDMLPAGTSPAGTTGSKKTTNS